MFFKLAVEILISSCFILFQTVFVFTDVIEKADDATDPKSFSQKRPWFNSEEPSKKDSSFVASTPNGNTKMEDFSLQSDTVSKDTINSEHDKVDGVNGIGENN